MTTELTKRGADGTAVPPGAPGEGEPSGGGRSAAGAVEGAAPGFLRRYRLPLALGLLALCIYVGSILYILFGRGQLA